MLRNALGFGRLIHIFAKPRGHGANAELAQLFSGCESVFNLFAGYESRGRPPDKSPTRGVLAQPLALRSLNQQIARETHATTARNDGRTAFLPAADEYLVFAPGRRALLRFGDIFAYIFQ